MKVLFVTYDFPYPPTSGGKSRAFNLIKHSKNKDNEIYLLSFTREDFDKNWEEELRKIGVKKISTYKRKKLKSTTTFGQNLISKSSIFKTLYFDKKFFKLLKSIIEENNIDIVHFESSYTGFYIGKDLKKLGVKQILGTENIEYLLYEDYIKYSGNVLKKPLLSYQVKRFKKEEKEMMKSADLVLAVTKEEAEHIEAISGEKSEVIANAIDIKDLKYKLNASVKNNLLFVGNFTYMPNIKAVSYFVNKVMPNVDKDTTLTVVGKKVKEVVNSDNRIIRKEFVQDLTEEYRNADALVFPIKIGGGTNFKILEAMALGTPVVGFADKIEKTMAKNGEEFYKADNAEEFVEQINRIKNNKDESIQITKNARKLVEENYSWEKVGKKLAGIWEKLKNEEN